MKEPRSLFQIASELSLTSAQLRTVDDLLRRIQKAGTAEEAMQLADAGRCELWSVMGVCQRLHEEMSGQLTPAPASAESPGPEWEGARPRRAKQAEPTDRRQRAAG